MNNNNAIVANDSHSVGATSGNGKIVSTVAANPIGNKFRRADCYGMEFRSHAELDAHHLLHGYTRRFGRNTNEFVSSRAFRKHTGKLTHPAACPYRVRSYHRGEALRPR
jgi:hypothetical protein